MGKIMGGLFIVASFFAVLIGMVYGYVANIIHLVTQNESIGMMIGRVIGIFIGPIGVVLGYM